MLGSQPIMTNTFVTYSFDYLTLSLPVTRICVNFSTVYNDMLVAKGLNSEIQSIHNFTLHTSSRLIHNMIIIKTPSIPPSDHFHSGPNRAYTLYLPIYCLTQRSSEYPWLNSSRILSLLDFVPASLLKPAPVCFRWPYPILLTRLCTSPHKVQMRTHINPRSIPM